MRNYEIIATLGPASDVEAVWSSMLAAGGTAFHLNTFHVELGQFALLELAEGQVIELVLASSSNHPNRLPVPHVDFFPAAFLSSAERCQSAPAGGINRR
jgi:hypothetical protein